MYIYIYMYKMHGNAAGLLCCNATQGGAPCGRPGMVCGSWPQDRHYGSWPYDRARRLGGASWAPCGLADLDIAKTWFATV